jgi:hypothetical protein
MLDGRAAAAAVAAEHEWWKAAVSGPLTTASVGRWRREMSADAQRFAGLHLAGFLREHGYEGARDAEHEVAIVPVADGVGPTNERLLLELARRSTVVLRPGPTTLRALHSQPELVFLGVRGQLDPSRGQPFVRRVVSTVGIGSGLVVRRLQRRPILWVRRATLHPRRPRDPLEVGLVVLLRLLALEVQPEEVWLRVPPAGSEDRPPSTRGTPNDM